MPEPTPHRIAISALEARFPTGILVFLMPAGQSAAERFLTSLTFVAKTPEGIVMTDRLTYCIGAGDTGYELVIGGDLREAEILEILRKSVAAGIYREARPIAENGNPSASEIALDAAVAQARDENLFDPPKPAVSEEPNMVVGILMLLVVIVIVGMFVKFVVEA